ncbi:SDR family NAD(P)-dependent oxidoreductase [Geomicrobium sp. JCM 19055]|uniref:SDR family NAD(P)-dependent oxidoreductase n=1 Tax=Geomicrobium sp. JCM 19055 TaxID=1460649 RepID=UPI00045ECF4A|nr:SDR family NAD(P)-dependent oxidoreductase [Geomicrobium sp. JCM 19055]GAJ97912.1 3-oxoacyl-[acyl-carrier protein] reductase [Geomicrobium sp. JCM 19055]
MRLQNKIALITGAGSGMGEAEALRFAKEGATVIATDINEEAVKQVVKTITAAGGQATAYKHNVASHDDWKQIMADVKDQFGRLDILVNNAGISLPTPFEQQTEEDWSRTYGININGVMFGMQQAIPLMEENGGSIVNISSISALTGMAGAGAYTASKGAVRSITKAAAVDYGKKNIRVNSVHPGYIVTPMSAPSMEQYKDYFLTQVALPQLGNAEEVANAVLFLASDEANHITGIELPVDGGVTAK